MESQIESIYGAEKKKSLLFPCFLFLQWLEYLFSILFSKHNIAYNSSTFQCAVCHKLKSVFNFYCSGGTTTVTKEDNVRQNAPCMEQHSTMTGTCQLSKPGIQEPLNSNPKSNKITSLIQLLGFFLCLMHQRQVNQEIERNCYFWAWLLKQ